MIRETGIPAHAAPRYCPAKSRRDSVKRVSVDLFARTAVDRLMFGPLHESDIVGRFGPQEDQVAVFTPRRVQPLDSVKRAQRHKGMRVRTFVPRQNRGIVGRAKLCAISIGHGP